MHIPIHIYIYIYIYIYIHVYIYIYVYSNLLAVFEEYGILEKKYIAIKHKALSIFSNITFEMYNNYYDELPLLEHINSYFISKQVIYIYIYTYYIYIYLFNLYNRCYIIKVYDITSLYTE